MIKKIIRGKKISNGLKFYTDKKEFLQLGVHSYTKPKTSRIHGLTKVKPFILKSLHKYIYVTKGKVTVEFFKSKNKLSETKYLKRGDSIIIGDIIHRVIFSKNSKAIEVKQGPHQDD